MRRFYSLLLALAIALSLVPTAVAAPPVVTLGFLPAKTAEPSIVVRGSAPAGMVVAISVNGDLQARVVAGPSMSVYYYAIDLEPGDNRIVVALEGTDARAEKRIELTRKTFGDLNGHWARDDAEYLATVGIVNGVGDEKFGPDLTLTRAQFAKMAVLALKLKPTAAPDLRFSDNEAIPEWAKGFVATAVAEGLITGHADGSFGPDEPVTRAQVAVIAARALRHKGVEVKGQAGRPFKDADLIPAWARADVAFTAGAGLVGDFWGEAFAADQPATRGLAAAVVRRLYTAK